MKLSEAVSRRIDELCNEQGITIYKLAKNGGLNKNTLYQIKDCSTVQLDTIHDVCDTLNISLSKFFDSPLFSRENLD